jgi:hypothetical protein
LLSDVSPTNIGAIDGIVVANPMGDATEVILGAFALSVDLIASAACWLAVCIPMGDTTET